MVEVVSNDGLGLFNSQRSGVGRQTSVGQSGEQVSVNAATGNLIVQRQDELIVGIGLDNRVVRTYNSQGNLSDDNGDNFRFSFNQRLYNFQGSLNQTDSSIVYVNGDGHEVVFEYSDGKYRSTEGAGAHDSLRYQDDQWIWREGSTGLEERFNLDSDSSGAATLGANMQWRMASQTDSEGRTTQYGYSPANGLVNRITDALGQELVIEYSGNNVEYVISLSKGEVHVRTHYGYDTQGRLSRVNVDLTPEDQSIADGKVYTTLYTYAGDSHRISNIVNSDGTELSIEYEYLNDAYHVSAIEEGSKANSDVVRTEYRYMPHENRTDIVQVTDSSTTPSTGLVTTLIYDEEGQLLQTLSPPVLDNIRSGSLPITGQRLATSYFYDSEGNLLSVTDGTNNTHVYHYDSAGNIVKEQNAEGDTLERTFSTDNLLLTETIFPAVGVEQTTHYFYDAQRRVRFILQADGSVTETRYTGMDTASGKISRLRYISDHFDVSILNENQTLNLSDLEAWAASVVAGFSGHSARIQRQDTLLDFRGQVQQIHTFNLVDQRGEGVDNRDELNPQLEPSLSVRYFIYDQHGRLLKEVNNGGHSPLEIAENSPSAIDHEINNFETRYVYDGLGRLLLRNDSLGQTRSMIYDDVNNQITTLLENNLQRVETYNSRGQLLSVSESDSQNTSTAARLTRYAYDDLGRQIAVQNVCLREVCLTPIT